MAFYFLRTTAISRSAGRSAPAAAAYRAGERIRDERTGGLRNYSKRRDVSHTEIFLPSALGPDAAQWARDRSRLWNAAEAAEHQRNSRVAREYQVSLPYELPAERRLELARVFAREMSDRHNIAVDLCVHLPRPDGDPRNHHAHLLATTREVGADGLGAKAGLDMHSRERLIRGLPAGLKELMAIRERWATLVNDAFREAGLEARVDHRTNAPPGVERLPMPNIPRGAIRMERRGQRSEIAERIRERYRARVAAHAAQKASPVVEPVRAPTPTSTPTSSSSSTSTPPLRGLAAIEELRQRSREAWLAMRSEALQAAEAAPTSAQTSSRSKAADKDYGL